MAVTLARTESATTLGGRVMGTVLVKLLVSFRSTNTDTLNSLGTPSGCEQHTVVITFRVRLGNDFYLMLRLDCSVSSLRSVGKCLT